MRQLSSWLVVLLVAWGGVNLHAAEVRYDDTIYLKDVDQSTFRLKALRRTPLTISRDPQDVSGYLAKGQAVEIIGFASGQYYVSVRLATGLVRGWVDAQAFQAPPAGLLEKLRAHRDKEQVHRDLITRHEVAAGMTATEVRASLGKPDRIAHVRVKDGNQEVWTYLAYQYVPYNTSVTDDSGQARQSVSYRRELTNRKTVTFQNNHVVNASTGMQEGGSAVAPDAGSAEHDTH